MKNIPIQKTLRFMEWVTLTFILVLGGLMAHDSLWSKQILNAGLSQLNELKLKDLADPELAKTVRDFDYLYRATYFQTQDRQSRGFLLLGIAFLGLCTLMCMERFLFVPDLNIPKQVHLSPEKERREILIFAACGLVVLCSAIIALRMTPSKILPPHEKTTMEELTVQTTPATSLPPSTMIPVKKISLSEAVEEETYQWPQFRGSVLPNRNPLPKTWSFVEKWKVRIPLAGFNSPVVWDNNIFVAGGNETERAIFCFDANNGDLRWKAVCNQTLQYPDVSDDTGVSAPTLCIDRQRVYGIFATGEMICCTHDGKEVWRKQMPFPEIMYGYASSPCLLGDKLIVQYDLDEKQTLYAINIDTGEITWETKRDAAPSWSSPTVLFREGNAVIFTAGNKMAEAFDAETGKSIWHKECMGGEVATSAFAVENAFYFSNASAFTGAFAVEDGTILCQNDNVPAPDVASSVLFGNKYLLFTSGGSVIAIDSHDGKELYEEVFDNGFYSSPVILQNKIVAVNLDGDLFLMDASGENLVIEGKFSIEKKIVAIPAFHQGNIIVRTFENELICLEAK